MDRRRQTRTATGVALLSSLPGSGWILLGCLIVGCTQPPRLQAARSAPPTTPRTDGTPKSLVTSLTAPACVVLQVQAEGGNSVQRCPGIRGYQLLVLDSDSRMSITVVDSEGCKWPLSYDQVISRSFTSLGPQAEWRTIEGDAGAGLMALAVKVNAKEDPESEAVTTYWAVARIGPADVCVTDRIEDGPDEVKRLEAAMALVNKRPCLPPR